MKRLLLVFLLSSILFYSCSSNEARTYQELRMDTVCSFTFYCDNSDEIAREGFALIDKISSMIDRFDEKSELSHVNSNASGGPVKVSDELFSLIKQAYGVCEYTDGAFNIAIAPLVDLWKIGSDEARRPSDEEIESVLPLLDYRNIILDDAQKTIEFRMDGMAIDLGGAGKGYAADALASLFREKGVESAIINLGGNVYMIGQRTDGKPWTVGLQSPGSGRGEYYTTVEAIDESVVTSGAYERYFIDSDGTLYHHILSSRTGYPTDEGIVSSSIISSSSTLADMLSTACFASSLDKAEEIAEHYAVKAVFLLDDQSIIRVGF